MRLLDEKPLLFGALTLLVLLLFSVILIGLAHELAKELFIQIHFIVFSQAQNDTKNYKVRIADKLQRINSIF